MPHLIADWPAFWAGAALLLLALVGLWFARRSWRRQLLHGRHRYALDALHEHRRVQQQAAADKAAAAKPTAAPVAEIPQALVGLERTKAHLWGRLADVFGRGPGPLDPARLAAIEEILLTSDVGLPMAEHLLTQLREAATAAATPLDTDEVRALLRAELLLALQPATPTRTLLPQPPPALPHVLMFVGVNGVGKTTTVGKIAALLTGRGQSVVLAAADTYRAAAAEQLTIWGKRSGAQVVQGAAGADPASVAYRGIQAGIAGKADYVLVDTAGRLHTQDDLMAEIGKVRRAMAKQRPGAPDEVWLVVDATTGQNALHQAKAFHEALGLTGIVLTKLDGTAKGGIVFAIAKALGVPICFVGLGEQAADLRPFEASAFVDALVAP